MCGASTAVTMLCFSCFLCFCLKDSELLDTQGDEADHNYQEEYFYDVSSSLPSYASTSVPFPTTVTVNRSNAPLSSLPEISYPSAQNKVDVIPTDMNEMSAKEHYTSDVKQDEDVPLYDAESDESKIPSNEYLLAEPLVPLMKDDHTSTSVHETSLFSNVTMVHSDMTASGIINNTAVSSPGLVLSNEPLISHLNTTNNMVPNPSAIHTDEIDEDGIYIENKTEISNQKESPAVHMKALLCEQTVSQHTEYEPGNMISDEAGIDFEYSLEAKTQNLDTVSDPPKHNELSCLAQPVHTTPEVQETLGISSAVSEIVITESMGKDELSVSGLKEVDSLADKTPAAVAVFSLTLASAEFLSPDNTVDISLESQDCKHDIVVEQSNNHVDSKSDSNTRHVDTGEPRAGALQCVELEHEAPKVDIISVTSAALDGSRQTLQEEDSDVKSLQDHRSSAYASVESLSPPEPPSRSSSQGSLRKESRAGRYHKRPAPTPPPKNLESESEDWAEVQDGNSKALVWPKELDEDVPLQKAISCENPESALTARLVLKPGVVRSLGPDSGTKAEVFVSRTPQAKHKKSKSKNKQGDSALSRLFVLPKNQFGSLSSYFPFWHGKQEALTSSDTQNGPPESSDLYTSSALQSSHKSEFVAVHENTSFGLEKNKSRSSSDVNVREMSCSPGQQRRAPLAEWE